MEKRRNSSIELLKILAIIFIIINHVTQTAGMTINEYVSFPLVYGVDLTSATCDFQTLLLIIFRRFGALGNDIFLICSIWFLLDSQRIKINKISNLVCETWFISVIIMLIFILGGVKLKPNLIIRSLLPTTYCNNWYITAYLLLYAIHPALNYVISGMKRRMHMNVVFALFVLYSILGTLNNDFWYYTHFMYFVMVYILIAFLKKYVPDRPKTVYLKILFSVILAQVACVLIVNVAGLHISIFDNRMMLGAKTSNPFCLVIAIALFYIVKKLSLDNVVINYISRLSLPIYLVHENILVRLIARPFAWNVICERFGVDYRAVTVLIISLLIFVISLVTCIIYKLLLQKFVYHCGDMIYKEIRSVSHHVLSFLKMYDE